MSHGQSHLRSRTVSFGDPSESFRISRAEGGRQAKFLEN